MNDRCLFPPPTHTAEIAPLKPHVSSAFPAASNSSTSISTLHDSLLSNRTESPQTFQNIFLLDPTVFKKIKSHFSHSRALQRSQDHELLWNVFCGPRSVGDVHPCGYVSSSHFGGPSTLSVFQCLPHCHQPFQLTGLALCSVSNSVYRGLISATYEASCFFFFWLVLKSKETNNSSKNVIRNETEYSKEVIQMANRLMKVFNILSHRGNEN